MIKQGKDTLNMNEKYILDDDISTLDVYGEYSSLNESLNEADDLTKEKAAQQVSEFYEKADTPSKIEKTKEIIEAVPDKECGNVLEIFKQKLKDVEMSEEAKEELEKEGINATKFKTYGEAIQATMDDPKASAEMKKILLVVASVVTKFYPPVGIIMAAVIAVIPKNIFFKFWAATSFPITTAVTYAIKKSHDKNK